MEKLNMLNEEPYPIMLNEEPYPIIHGKTHNTTNFSKKKKTFLYHDLAQFDHD